MDLKFYSNISALRREGRRILSLDDYSSRRDTVVCTSCYFRLKGNKPLNTSELPVSKTLGEHLRKVRIQRKLSQSQVAKILNVVTDTVTLWELNRNEPTQKYAAKIIKFIGYFPFEWEHENLQTKVNYARMVSGQTLKQMGKEIGVDASTMYKIFNEKSEPKFETLRKIFNYLKKQLN